ncbi:MAG: hypothetical protein J6Z49_00555 [Kiritimatiellae bacterium]|nr:hypothetical protein [Kiritimatiellia bacterium]
MKTATSLIPGGGMPPPSAWGRGIAACFLAVLVSAIAGCSSPKIIRTGQYVDMDNDRLHVVYFEKAHTESVNGVEFPFKEAVKILLPDGKKITCLRTVSPGGMRYRSADNKYMFYEKGPYCILFFGNQRIFEGIFCRDKD